MYRLHFPIHNTSWWDWFLAERELPTFVCGVLPLRKLQIQHNKGPHISRKFVLLQCDFLISEKASICDNPCMHAQAPPPEFFPIQRHWDQFNIDYWCAWNKTLSFNNPGVILRCPSSDKLVTSKIILLSLLTKEIEIVERTSLIECFFSWSLFNWMFSRPDRPLIWRR